MNHNPTVKNKNGDIGTLLGSLNEWAGILFSIQFVGVIVVTDIAHILNITLNNIWTASLWYVPSILALLFLWITSLEVKRNYRTVLVSMSLLYIVLLWFIVDLTTLFNSYDLSEYDSKRPYYLIHGVLIVGFIGIFASRHWRVFIHKFIIWTFFISLIVCFLYLSIYHVHMMTARLGGATALQHSIIFTVGVSCAFAMLYQRTHESSVKPRLSIYTLWFSIIFLTIGIVFSGTRAALLGVVVSFALYIHVLSNRRMVLALFVSIAAAVTIAYVAAQWIPQNVVDRVTHPEVGGVDRRIQLNELALESFERHPFGKTRGYINALDGVDYAHNTILQMAIELGIAGIPALAILLIFAAAGWLKAFRSRGYVVGALIILFNLLLQSFSSGDAYDSMFWFAICFLATLPKIENRFNEQSEMRYHPIHMSKSE